MIGRLIDILVFAVIAFSWAIPYTGHIITTTASIGLTIFFLVFLRTKGHFRFPKYFLLPWLFIVYDFISVLWAPDQEWALGSMIQIQSAAILGTSIWFSMANGNSPRVVVAGFAVGGTIGIASSIQELLYQGFSERIAGVFMNSNSLAMYCSYAAFAIWFGLDKRPKWATWSAVLFILIPFLFTGSRKMIIVLLVLAIAVLWAIIMHPIPRMRRLILVTTIVVMLGCSFFMLRFLEDTQLFRRTSASIETAGQGSTEIRGELIVMGWELWKQNPFFGYGSGQFAPVAQMPYYSHNTYIELLVNDGLIGLVLFHTLIGLASCRAIQKLPDLNTSYPYAFWNILLILCVNFGMTVLGDFVSWIFMCFASHLALHKTVLPIPARLQDSLIAQR